MLRAVSSTRGTNRCAPKLAETMIQVVMKKRLQVRENLEWAA
jgi:hypothetical protein